MWMEGFGVAAVAAEGAHLALLFQRRVEVDGLAMAIALSAGTPLLIMALLLLATRRASNVARWFLVVLAMLALLTAVVSGIGAWADNPILLVGGLSLLLQIAAIAMSFTPGGNSWFARGLQETAA
jgi:hypothetical protein